MKTKNFFCMALMSLIIVSLICSCGEGGKIGTLIWKLDGDILTINGQGPMPDFKPYSPPWIKHGSPIKPINTVVIGAGVTSIGELSLHNLTSIIVEDGNSNYTSIDGVLFNKDKTTLIYMPRGRTGAYTIPNGVIKIWDNAFDYCRNLTSITIPSSVTTIGSDAFSSCFSLTSITIPESVTNIGERAFLFCEKLTSITIPNSVTTIGARTFEACENLKTIYLGKNVKFIGSKAFHRCPNIESITSMNPVPPTLESIVFDYTNYRLIVPNEFISAYKNDTQWGLFFKTDKEKVVVFDLN